MKSVAWVFPVLSLIALTTSAACTHRQIPPRGFAQQSQGFEQRQNIRWYSSSEYDAYIRLYAEQDNARRATAAEQFFVNHADATPEARTKVYEIMFLAYESAGNWAKVVETFDRIGLAPNLTPEQKEKFAQSASSARQRLGR